MCMSKILVKCYLNKIQQLKMEKNKSMQIPKERKKKTNHILIKYEFFESETEDTEEK